jgi:hypothetical protein
MTSAFSESVAFGQRLRELRAPEEFEEYFRHLPTDGEG